MLEIDKKKYPRSSELLCHYGKHGYNYETKRNWILISKDNEMLVNDTYEHLGSIEFEAQHLAYDYLYEWVRLELKEIDYGKLSDDQAYNIIDNNFLVVLKKEFKGNDIDIYDYIYTLI